MTQIASIICAKMMRNLSILTLWLPWLFAGIVAQDPFLQFPPSNTQGLKNHDVTMYCQVADKGSSDLFWHCTSHNGNLEVTIGPETNTNLLALPRYIIDNSAATLGQYNLIISNVTELDSGTCDCLIIDSKGNPQWSGARLDVVDVPSQPEEPSCTIDKDSTPGQSIGTFVAEDTVTLSCESKGGVPLPEIHWEIVRLGSNGKGTKIHSIISTSENSITAIAEYSITSLDHSAYFQCVQNHVTVNETITCSPTYTNSLTAVTRGIGSWSNPIAVKYPPVLTFVPSSLEVSDVTLESTTETIRCEYHANPGIDWGPIIRHRPLFVNETLTLISNEINNASVTSVDLLLLPDDVGKVIECVASNELGVSVTTLEIERYMPKSEKADLPTWILVIIILSCCLLLFIIAAVVLCLAIFFWKRKKNNISSSADHINSWKLNNDTSSEDNESVDVERQQENNDDDDEEQTEEVHEGGEEEEEPEPDVLENVDVTEFEGGQELVGTPEVVEDEESPPPSLDPGLFQPSWSTRLYDQIPLDLY
ncbi:uncharacterized protein [Amphiura filiformis]|uniref:uncharacterized protein n=1 Tax=Amphiura filiformis TaxID=82378 RepID=UPI003B211BFB